MAVSFNLSAAIFAATLLAGPALAEAKKHRGAHGDDYVAAHCPPGLARKNPPCVPPGQAGKPHKKHREDRQHRIGERLDPGHVILIRDPGRYGLALRNGWTYYRDPYGIYRVDPETRKILAILDLIEAFAK